MVTFEAAYSHVNEHYVRNIAYKTTYKMEKENQERTFNHIYLFSRKKNGMRDAGVVDFFFQN